MGWYDNIIVFLARKTRKTNANEKLLDEKSKRVSIGTTTK
jgi:hypothetical protein